LRKTTQMRRKRRNYDNHREGSETGKTDVRERECYQSGKRKVDLEGIKRKCG
jgi:hypothetical protein